MFEIEGVRVYIVSVLPIFMSALLKNTFTFSFQRWEQELKMKRTIASQVQTPPKRVVVQLQKDVIAWGRADHGAKKKCFL